MTIMRTINSIESEVQNMKDMLKIVKVTKLVDDKDNKGKQVEKTYFNIYLFGVAIKCVNEKDYLRLYYQVKGYLQNVKEEEK